MAANASILPDDLVSGPWLEAHLDQPSLRVVDIRGYVRTTDLGHAKQRADYLGAADEYAVGHVPGAVYVDWTTDITDPDDPTPAQIAPPARFAEVMGGVGIGNETDVVVVDHTGGHFATRLWWALRYHGHDRVAVLDGGHNLWVEEGRPLSAVVPTFGRATFVPVVRPELRADVEDVVGAIESRTSLLIDARDGEQYRGEVARGPRGGHIPSAVHIPAKSLFRQDGRWKPVSEQRRLLEAGGVRPDRPAIAYCNGGVTATAVLFALHRTGLGTGANYDGSWNEWGERADLPAEIGGKT